MSPLRCLRIISVWVWLIWHSVQLSVAVAPSTTSLTVAATHVLPNSEWTALQTLFETTNGTLWKFRTPYEVYGVKWNFTTNSQGKLIHNPCSSLQPWQGITCSSSCTTSSCNILEIRLMDLNLRNFLPAVFGNFTHLTKVALSANFHLSGAFPADLAACPRLAFIELRSNSLVGSLPDSWCNLSTSLVHLDVGGNFGEGPIPLCYGQLVHLQTFDLGGNPLHGTIPNIFAEMKELQSLDLHYCRLQGPIPLSILNATSLQSLELSHNQLTSTIPPDIGFALSNLSALRLSKNSIQGTIPKSLGSLQNLTFLHLDRNNLTSSIPESLYQATRLLDVLLYSNDITGSISPAIGQWIHLQNLDVFSLSLTGPLPESIAGMSNIRQIEISSNFLSHSLPAGFGNMSKLLLLECEGNFFSQQLPAALVSLPSLQALFANANEFDSSIPDLYSRTNNLRIFLMNDNFITGVLPPTVCSWYRRLSQINVSMNLMDGTIPSCFDTFSEIQVLTFSNNFFTGTLWDVSTMRKITELDVNNNFFSGSLSHSLNSSRSLAILNLANNFFSGSFPNSNFSAMKAIYLQNNVFSGPLPDYLFETAPYLFVFSASVNCFSGIIPFSICQATLLSQLELSGLHSSPHCAGTFAIGNHYVEIKGVTGTLPMCILSLSQLETLHVSGNLLSGSIVTMQNVSSKLMNFSLSSNDFVGDIPDSLWTSAIAYLDLSFNRFRATVPIGYVPSTALSNTTSLDIHRNRLSGYPPVGLAKVTSLNVLAGNMFGCDIAHNNLPSNDPNADTYSCGSTSINEAMLMWTVLSLCGTGLLVLAYQRNWWKAEWAKHKLWFALFLQAIRSDTLNYISTFFAVFGITFDGPFLILIASLFAIVILLVPIYGLLSSSFGAYVHSYSWVITAAFLEGIGPFILFMLLFISLTGGLLYTYRWLLTSQEMSRKIREAEAIDEQDTPIESAAAAAAAAATAAAVPVGPTSKATTAMNVRNKAQKTLVSIAFLLVNGIVVLAINMLYVLSLSQPLTINEQNILTTGLSLFKLLWNDILVWRGSHHFKDSALVVVSIFNNILAPIFAEVVTSPNCFLYLISLPPSQTSSIRVVTCIDVVVCIVDNCRLGVDCTFDQVWEKPREEISFIPPFVYSFQCSSSVLATYSYVFMIRYILSGILQPLLYVVLKWIQPFVTTLLVDNSGTNEQTIIDGIGVIAKKSVSYLCIRGMPTLWRPIFDESSGIVIRTPNKRQLGRVRQRILIQMATDIAVFVTFGLAVPPVGIFVLVSFFIHLLMHWLSIGRLVDKSQQARWQEPMLLVLRDLNEAFHYWQASLPWSCIAIMIPMTFFWMFLVVDALGNVIRLSVLWIVTGLYILFFVAIVGVRYVRQCVHKNVDANVVLELPRLTLVSGVVDFDKKTSGDSSIPTVEATVPCSSAKELQSNVVPAVVDNPMHSPDDYNPSPK